MEKRVLKFAVFDVDGGIHEVTVEQEIGNTINLSATCSCGKCSGEDFCVHCFDILAGDTRAVASSNSEDLDALRNWVRGSDIETAMIELSKAKTELRMAMEKTEACRRKLARRMMD